MNCRQSQLELLILTYSAFDSTNSIGSHNVILSVQTKSHVILFMKTMSFLDDFQLRIQASFIRDMKECTNEVLTKLEV